MASLVLGAAGIFVLDLLTPLGVAVPILYVIIVLLSLRLPMAYTLTTAVVSTVLVVVGFFFSPPGGVVWLALVNRPLSVFVIWLTAILGLRHRRAEAALQDSEQFLRTVFNGAHDAMLVIDPTRDRILGANPGACELLDYGPEELSGLPLSQLHPQEMELMHEVWDALLSGKPVATDKLTYTTRSGRVISAEISFSLLKFRGRQQALAIARDITERKRMEEAVRESELRYREVFDHTSDCLFLLDVTADGRFRFAGFNPAEEKAVGMSNSAVCGRFVEDVAPEEVAKEVIANYRRCVQAGTLINYEEELNLPVGHRWFNTTLVPVREGDGRICRIIGVARDITERRQVEAAMRESQQLLQAIIDNSTAVIYVKDLQGRYVLINRRHEELFHSTRESLVGKTDYDLFSEEIAEALRTLDKRVLAAGTVLEAEEVVPHNDGGLHTYISIKCPLFNESGEAYAVCGISTDITERKRAEQALQQAHDELELRVKRRTAELSEANTALQVEMGEHRQTEEALRQSEQRLGSILGSLNDVVWSLSTKTYDLLYLNPTAERLYGHKLSEFFDDKNLWSKVVHPDDRERVIGSLSDLLRTGACDLEYRIVHPDGEVRWVHDRGRVIYADDGEMLRIDGLVTDLTERKRAQAQLAESQRRLQALFDYTQDAILLADDEARIVDVNPAACTLFGYRRETFLQFALWDITPVFDRKLVGDLWRAFIAAGQKSSEYTIQRPDGTSCAIESRAVANIVPGLHLLVIRDVTQRKLVEDELRESSARLRGLSAHLQSVREEQSAKIAREVHDDLGGTLSMLKLGVAQVLEKIKEPDPLRYKLASLLQLADGAIQGVKRISTSLRPSMLDTLGLTATIKWHSNEFSHLTGIGNELHMPDHVRLSPEHSTAVFRIFQEALTNVARHAHATKVTIKVWKNKGRLFVEIADNGRGISQDAFAKQESFGILGMRERSQFLGGELTVSGAASQGTTVSFSVPFD